MNSLHTLPYTDSSLDSDSCYKILGNTQSACANILKYRSFQEYFNQFVDDFLSAHKPCNAGNYSDTTGYLEDMPTDIFSTVSRLQKKLNFETTADKIIAIPVYAGEKQLEKLIASLEVIPDSVPVVLYFNASKEAGFSIVEFTDNLQKLQAITRNSSNIFLIENLYNGKKTIGHIRADMIDSILLYYNDSPIDPIIIGLDADTYKLEGDIPTEVDSYFSDSEKKWGVMELQWSETHAQNPSCYISEKIMQSNCIGGVMNANKESYPHSFGAVSCFRLSAYRHAGGYNRNLSKFEDLELGKKIDTNAPTPAGGFIKDTRANVDPRRGVAILNKGGIFPDQWRGDFTPIENLEKNEYSKYLDTYFLDIFNGTDIDNSAKKELEYFINAHYPYQLLWTEAKENFCHFFEKQFPNALYGLGKRKGSGRLQFYEK